MYWLHKLLNLLLIIVLILANPAISLAVFPTTSLLDDFNRTNEDPVAGSWSSTPILSGMSNMKVVSNALKKSTNVAASGSAWINTVYGPGVEAYVDFTTIHTSTVDYDAWLWLNGNAENTGGVDGYICYFNKTSGGVIEWGLYIVTNNVITRLGAAINTTQDLSNGNKIGCSHDGTTLEMFYHNGTSWTSMGTRSDSTYTTGHIGVSIGTNTNTDGVIDNFSGGNIVTASSLRSRMMRGFGN